MSSTNTSKRYYFADADVVQNLSMEFDQKLVMSLLKVADKPFPPGSLNRITKISLLEELQCLLVFMIFPGSLVFVPLLFGSFFLLLNFWTATAVSATLVVLLSGIPIVSQWPPYLIAHAWLPRLLCRYFSAKGVFSTMLDPTQKYVVVAPPHGVFPFGNVIAKFAIPRMFGFCIHGLGASVLFRLPVVRHVVTGLGMIPADRDSAKLALSRGESVGISSGGIAEIFETHQDDQVVVLRDRTGFVRLAMQTGALLVPAYIFGNTELLDCITDSSGYLQRLSRKLRVSVTLFWGRFFLPVPYRKPVVAVMADPIPVPHLQNPSADLIAEYHGKFLSSLQELFDTHKASYGWAHKKLIIK
eukprot:GILK01004999.1.p1 GENE.GILK01004999.1~~GILK01004999.1.p1  ORF type:complete len:357 (+),score=33.95 GILK01004999.1:83-1153(+)